MGFFSDLKEDLSQASGDSNPNRVMTPEEIMAAFAAAAAAEEPVQEEVVQEQPAAVEFTDVSDESLEASADEGMSDISLEEMLKNIDNIAFPGEENGVADSFNASDASADASMEEGADAASDSSDASDASIEEMFAAAIAALPEREEDAAEVMETAKIMDSMGSPASDGGAESVEAAGILDPAEEEGKTVYESLIPEETVQEQLEIEEPVVEEPQPAEDFRQELMADMPEVEHIPDTPVPTEQDLMLDIQAFDQAGAESVVASVGETAMIPDIPEEISGEMPEAVKESPKEVSEQPQQPQQAERPEVNAIPEGTSVIAAGMHICGDLNATAPVNVEGSIEGNVDIDGKLSVTGQIHGNIHAAEIYANGARLNGDVVSEGAVKLGASAVVKGNITANSAAIAGAVKGDIDVKGPVILDSSAIVVGNIKFKSIQINNGAVIEGMCLQCYADVSPTSFFDED
ncbi:MAG: polymer-forming cytoskeletal protein [Lachnospiraceae bacterium]|nr:polymer-forming cytoskeletal protein [Lachnospiraceae bacterium]